MTIESAAELYVHAMAIEREAAERYREFASRMADQGNEALADVFGRLAGFESEHLKTLERRTDGVALPPLAADYRWLDAGAPETAAHELIFRLLTPARRSPSRFNPRSARAHDPFVDWASVFEGPDVARR